MRVPITPKLWLALLLASHFLGGTVAAICFWVGFASAGLYALSTRMAIVALARAATREQIGGQG